MQRRFFYFSKKGICASQNQLFYGYKIHAVCTFSGVIILFNLTKANVDDIHYLADVKEQIADCILIGDKGYLSASLQLDLFQTANIRLETPMRANQNNYKKQPYIYRKTRKKIETFFSQLCDQFMIRRIYAKSFLGFKTRILAKISALILVQYINKFFFDRNISWFLLIRGSPGQVQKGEQKPHIIVRFFCVYILLVILYSAKTIQIDGFWRIIYTNH